MAKVQSGSFSAKSTGPTYTSSSAKHNITFTIPYVSSLFLPQTKQLQPQDIDTNTPSHKRADYRFTSDLRHGESAGLY